jgi:TolA-binding protein
MAVFSDKKDMNEIIIFSLEWIKNNRNTFFTALATVLGVLILGIFFAVQYSTLQGTARDKLAYAQAQLYQGQQDQGMAMLDDIIAKYSSSDVAAQARLIKANYLISKQDFLAAENTLAPLADKDKPKLLVPLALSMLGTVQENEGKVDDAIKTYSRFLDKYPDHFLAAKTYESLARVYEIKRSIPEAISNYEKLANLYPNTGWAQRAQERLSILSRLQPQQSQPLPPGALMEPKALSK